MTCCTLCLASSSGILVVIVCQSCILATTLQGSVVACTAHHFPFLSCGIHTLGLCASHHLISSHTARAHRQRCLLTDGVSAGYFLASSTAHVFVCTLRCSSLWLSRYGPRDTCGPHAVPGFDYAHNPAEQTLHWLPGPQLAYTGAAMAMQVWRPMSSAEPCCSAAVHTCRP